MGAREYSISREDISRAIETMAIVGKSFEKAGMSIKDGDGVHTMEELCNDVETAILCMMLVRQMGDNGEFPTVEDAADMCRS